MTVCDMAVEILSGTRYGNDLYPPDLSLVQGAVNGNLNDSGHMKFVELHRDVRQGRYKPPWLHGIENLTIDHEGYVYWKKQHVEHYNFPWAFSDKGKEQAEELAIRCQYLESIGEEVSTRTAIWQWDQYKPKTKEER